MTNQRSNELENVLSCQMSLRVKFIHNSICMEMERVGEVRIGRGRGKDSGWEGEGKGRNHIALHFIEK